MKKEQLKELMDKHGLSGAALGRGIGAHRNQVYKWLWGKAVMGRLWNEKIVKYFDDLSKEKQT